MHPVVILYKSDGQGGLELHYTLRSLKNISNFNGQVFVVGDSEPWFKNITVIKAPQSTASPYKDVELKMMAVINDVRVPDDFILLNDDFFTTTKTTVRDMHSGVITSGTNGYHNRAKQKTKEFLIKRGIKEPLNYSIHVPMIMNKQKRLEVHYLIKPTLDGVALLSRTVYGNIFNLSGEYYEDKKTKTPHLKEGEFISTQYYTDELKKLFPRPCRYEITQRSTKRVDLSRPAYGETTQPIPNIVHQIWLGPLDPPLKWMQTWSDMNPNWEYMHWNNKKVFARKWRNQHIIDEYRKRCERVKKKKQFISARGGVFTGEKATLFAWHVIADLIRYEILYEYGGYMPGSDSVCIKCIDDKFTQDFDVYTVRTGSLHTENMSRLREKYPNEDPTDYDKVLWGRYQPLNCSPILAAKKGSPFLKQCIEELHKLKPEELGEAVDTTGNVFMGKMIQKYNPDIHMPDFGAKSDRVTHNPYSIHYAGTTKNRYSQGR